MKKRPPALHTPGPWRRGTANDGLYVVADQGSGSSDFVASVHKHPSFWTKTDANANLIAKAPQLLEKMVEVVADIREGHPPYVGEDSDVERLIREALGEKFPEPKPEPEPAPLTEEELRASRVRLAKTLYDANLTVPLEIAAEIGAIVNEAGLEDEDELAPAALPFMQELRRKLRRKWAAALQAWADKKGVQCGPQVGRFDVPAMMRDALKSLEEEDA